MARTKTSARRGSCAELREAERAQAAVDRAERRHLAALGRAVQKAELACAATFAEYKHQIHLGMSDVQALRLARVDANAAMAKREKARRAFFEVAFKRSEDEPGTAVATVWKAAVAAAVALDSAPTAPPKVKAEPAE